MGNYGKLELKQQSQALRKLGYSYNQIIKKLGVNKSTLSYWCRDIILSKDQLSDLYASKIKGALKGSAIAANKKRDKRLQLTKDLYQRGYKEIGRLSKRDKFIAGVVFYASEGTKIDKSCCFSNSDPYFVKFMVRWFRDFGHIKIDKLKGALWLHEGLDEMKAKEYWSKITRIPVENFYKTYVAKNKTKSKKIRKNIHKNGVFSFYISDVQLMRKIMGWIGGVVGKQWYNSRVRLHSPVAQR